MKKRSRFLQVPIEPFTVEPDLTADAILEKMERISFQGRSLGTAHRVWQKMLDDDVTIFMGMAGALSAGGLKRRSFGASICAIQAPSLGIAVERPQDYANAVGVGSQGTRIRCFWPRLGKWLDFELCRRIA